MLTIFFIKFRRRKSNVETDDENTEMSTLAQTSSHIVQSTQQLIIDGIESDTAKYVNVSSRIGVYNHIDCKDGRSGQLIMISNETLL